MAKIRYIGSDDPTEHAKTTAYGTEFLQGAWVDYTPKMEKLKENPMFQFSESDKPPPDKKAETAPATGEGAA